MVIEHVNEENLGSASQVTVMVKHECPGVLDQNEKIKSVCVCVCSYGIY